MFLAASKEKATGGFSLNQPHYIQWENFVILKSNAFLLSLICTLFPN